MIADFYEDEKFSRAEKEIGSRQAFSRLLPFLKKYRKSLTICLGILAVAQVASLYWPKLVKDAVDTDIADSDFNGLLVTVAIIAGLQIATIILQYIQRVWLEIIGQKVMVDLKGKLFDHIMSLDLSYFDSNPVGRLMARVESDTEALRLFFTNTAVLVVGDVLLIFGVFGVMMYYSWQLSLILMASLPVLALLVYIFERATSPRFLAVRKMTAEVTAMITEFLHGMSIIQIFNRGAYARAKVYEANLNKFREGAVASVAVVAFFNTVFFVQYVMVGIVLFLGLLWRAEGWVSTGTIIMFLILIWKMYEPIWRVSEQLSTIQKAIAGSKRIFALLAQESKINDTTEPKAWKCLEQTIKFENVWFAYEDENWILKDVSFELPKGKRFALVGVTGGGKTTIISLLLRFYDPQRGRITVDGIDIRELALNDLRSRFALVLQDIYLFPGDVYSNIALESKEIPKERIKEAARLVDADRFISELPENYSTEVSEKGTNFSRGERQLLSFARALAANPDVLVLDEATSSVDPETERTIQESLKKLMTGRTSLVIAHRLSTILDVDRILVLRRGELVEQGTHTELILQDGYYSKLFHLQFKNKNGVTSNVG